MKNGEADGPMMALLLLLGGIIGFVAYLNRDHQRWYGSEELEVEYYVPSARTEAPMSSEQHEDFGINTESEQETPTIKLIREYREHTTQFFEMQDIE